MSLRLFVYHLCPAKFQSKPDLCMLKPRMGSLIKVDYELNFSENLEGQA